MTTRHRDELGLAGKIAAVTGAGRGIGAATATLLAHWGARVTLIEIDSEAARATVAAITDAGGTAEAVPADVCDEAGVIEAFEGIVRRHGRMDILVNAVGGGRPAATDEIAGADWDRMFAFNAKSAFLCCREAARHMRRTGGGRIVNVASLAGRTSSPLQGPHYSASKAAVIGLTRHLARELAADNILVNAIAPGATETERIRSQMTPERRASLTARIPLGRLATPEDQAGAILFLVSSLAGYVTGITIDVSGGILLG